MYGGRRRSVPLVLVEALEERLTPALMVTNTLDSGSGSLRQAILDANMSPGPDTITFDPVFFSVPRTITIASTPAQIGAPLTIIGPGSSLLTVQRNGAGIEPGRHAFDSVASSLTMSGMTVTGGSVGGGGGGLSAVGITPNVALDDMVFTGNSANGFGGAIYLGNGATLTIRNSVISNNSANGGGGIYFFSGGALVMENCTVTGNRSTVSTGGGGGGIYFAGAATAAPPPGFTPGTLVIRGSTIDHNTSASFGGGVMVDGLAGTLLVQNSTISGNTAATSGGGIAGTGGSGAITVQNSTITANTANGTATASVTGGGGVLRTSTLNNTLTIVNSIVSGNTNANAPDIRTDAFTTTHENFSAIGSGIGFTLAADSGNNLPLGANLKLEPLAANGGPTLTHAMQATSPLINAGSNPATPAQLTTDQRGAGFPRIVGAAVDIGAFERDAGPPVVASAQFLYLTGPQSLRFTFTENVGQSLGVPDLVLKNLTTGATIPAAALALSYDTNGDVATFRFPGYPLGTLPDGNYHAMLTASGITNSSGTPMAADFTFDFFFLQGDANHDRSVNFNDLVAVAQNYNTTSGATFDRGDFTYDGKVDFTDLVILAQRYNTMLAAPASVPVSAPATAPAPVFSSSPRIAFPPAKPKSPPRRR